MCLRARDAFDRSVSLLGPKGRREEVTRHSELAVSKACILTVRLTCFAKGSILKKDEIDKLLGSRHENVK